MKRSLQLLLLLFLNCVALPVFAQNTALVMDSDPGDYIGAGGNYYYTPADGAFTISQNYDNGVSLSFANGSHNWSLDFAAPDKALLKVKDYPFATRFPFQEMTEPGLNVDGDGRGCNTLTGEFNVLQIVYGADNTITSFHATFVQHCEGMGPALHGEVLYNSSAPLPKKNHLTSALSVYGTRNQFFQYDIRASDNPISFTASHLPAGLTLDTSSGVISGIPTVQGTFSIPLTATGSGGVASGTLTLILDPPGQSTGPYSALFLESDEGDFVGQGETSLFRDADGNFTIFGSGSYLDFGFTAPGFSAYWNVDLSSANGSIIEVGTYYLATRFASSANPGLDVTGDSRGCNESSGFFEVKELAMMNSSVASAHATFVQHCENGDPALRGEFWFNSNNAITSEPYAMVMRDHSFSYQIVGNNSPTSYTAVALPSGLTFNPASGIIAGTATVGGRFSVPMTAKGPTLTATGRLSITIVPPENDGAPVISSPLEATATIRKAFSYQTEASAGPTLYAAAGLPAGLSLDTATGLISGAPTVTGIFNVIITARNGSGTGGSSLTLTVYPPIPAITSVNHATASSGTSFSFQVSASNTPTSYSASGLPDGLTIGAGTGLISGIPTALGTSLVTVRAGNGTGVGFQSFTLTVVLGKPNITSALTADATEGQPFYYQIVADGTPTSFAASGLPDGLFVTPSDGMISGTPSGQGTFNITLSATNATGTGSATLVLTLTGKPGQLLNISTRLEVGTGEDVLIGGFIVTGQTPKKVLIRGLGPSLAAQGVSMPLADPVLELHDSTGAIVATDDNWKDSQQAEIAATTIPPPDDLEAAIIATLPADGAGYTAILRGKGSAAAVGLLEIYDLDQSGDSLLANISTRGVVAAGDNVMIGGFIIAGGSADGKVLVRGIGPSLTAQGISNALPDPSLELHNGDGDVIARNEDWQDMQKAQIIATQIPPSNPREAAIVATLPPGNYTAVLRGKGQSSGVALVEIYRLP